MTWRLGICFSASVFTLLTLAAPSEAAMVTGSVELSKAGNKTDFSAVVVWLEPLRVHEHPEPRRLRMVQKNKTFSPHLLPVSLGSSVEFPNLDPIFHNAFSNFNGQVFDLALYPPGKSRTVTFRRPGVVRIFCNIHPAMSAVIVVLDTPYYTVSDKLGRFAVGDVPPGRYRENVFYELATPETLTALSRDLEIGDAPAVLPTIRISEAGYLPLPHTNKHGQPYPNDSDKPYTVQ